MAARAHSSSYQSLFGCLGFEAVCIMPFQHHILLGLLQRATFAQERSQGFQTSIVVISRVGQGFSENLRSLAQGVTLEMNEFDHLALLLPKRRGSSFHITRPLTWAH